MGILPLQFQEGENRKTLGLDGSETILLEVDGVELKSGQDLTVTVTRQDLSTLQLVMKCRLDTANEVAYFRAGGILPYVLKGYLTKRS